MKKQPGRIEKVRALIANVINPIRNSATSLSNNFLRNGNRRPMDPGWTDVRMSDVDLYTGYAYAAIRNRSNKVAKIANKNIRTKSNVEDLVHPYLDIINTSPTFSNKKFWNDISTFIDLEGVYYLMAVRAVQDGRIGNVQEFKLLNPYNIRRVLDSNSLEVVGYVETRKGFVREIPKELIIEIRDLNPFDEDIPFAMTDAAKESQFILKTSGDYTRHALKHNVNAPGILTTDVILDEAEFSNFTERVRNHTKGEPIFGNGQGAITWENMQIELSKAALKDINEIKRDELFAVTGVSKTIMGIEQSGTTRDTAQIQKDLNTENQILPRIQDIIDALNQDYKNNFTKDFDRTEATIVVDDPLAIDHEADKLKTEVQDGQFELYKSLVNAGFDRDLASSYVMGEIELDQLGEPTNKPDPVIPTQPTEEKIDKKKVEKNQFEEESQGIVKEQQGALQNAVVAIETQLSAAAMNRVIGTTEKNSLVKNQFEKESEVVTEAEKKAAINELFIVLLGFYGIITQIKGGQTMRDRAGQFAMVGLFKLNKKVKDAIKVSADKAAKSHINTISNDLHRVAREGALRGDSRKQIASSIQDQYATVISKSRAEAIARTETNRAFTLAQFEADIQFIEQNELQGRAFKKWTTRSDNPCPFCLQLASEPPIPFDRNFRDFGGTVTAGDQILDISYSELEAGNAHVNCSCVYELIIENNFNSVVLKEMETKYKELDKRTNESKQILEDIKTERARVARQNKALEKRSAEVEKQAKELDEIL